MKIREIAHADLPQLLDLYTQLHGNEFPAIVPELEELWQEVLADKRHHILVGEINKSIISSCVLVIIPNLTHNQRPYALIENVITHEAYRQKGYATAILGYAKGIAVAHNCYKIMLLTGSKKEETLQFYEKAGYNRQDKTAFILWINQAKS